MAKEPDVVRVAAAFNAPGLKYRSFGNMPVRHDAPRGDVATQDPEAILRDIRSASAAARQAEIDAAAQPAAAAADEIEEPTDTILSRAPLEAPEPVAGPVLVVLPSHEPEVAAASVTLSPAPVMAASAVAMAAPTIIDAVPPPPPLPIAAAIRASPAVAAPPPPRPEPIAPQPVVRPTVVAPPPVVAAPQPPLPPILVAPTPPRPAPPPAPPVAIAPPARPAPPVVAEPPPAPTIVLTSQPALASPPPTLPVPQPAPEPAIDWAALASSSRPAPPVIRDAEIAAFVMPEPATAPPAMTEFSLLEAIGQIPEPSPAPPPSQLGGTLARLRSQITGSAEQPLPSPAYQAAPAGLPSSSPPTSGFAGEGIVPAAAVTVSLGEVMRLIAAGNPPAASPIDTFRAALRSSSPF